MTVNELDQLAARRDLDAGVLRQDFPDIPDTVLAQVLSAIEGVDAGKLQRLFLGSESEGKDEIEAEMEFEMSGDGSGAPNVIAKPKVKAAAARPRAAPAKVDKESQGLTRDDHLAMSGAVDQLSVMVGDAPNDL